MVKKHMRLYSSTSFHDSHELDPNAYSNEMREIAFCNNFSNMSSVQLSVSS